MDEFDGNPFGPGIDYRVPPTGRIPGEVYVVLTPDEAPPGSTVSDQHGRVIGVVPVATPVGPNIRDLPDTDNGSPPAVVPLDPGMQGDLGQPDYYGGGPRTDDFGGDPNHIISPIWPPEPGVYLPPNQIPDFSEPDPVEPGVIVPIPNPITSYGNPSQPIEGGPEEAGPRVDIDGPSLEPRDTQPPQIGPIEGEYIPRPRQGPVIFDDEGFPEFGYDREGPYTRRQIDVDRIVERAIMRGIGRMIGGPLGGAIGPVFAPEILGSGEMPLPPLPQVSIPAPVPTLPNPSFGMPSPPEPEIDHPAVPDVITVTPEDLWPDDAPAPIAPVQTSAPSTPAPLPTSHPWWQLLSGLIVGRATRPRNRPIPRGATGPGLSLLPEINPTTTLPRTTADPLTPPLPTPGTDPLTPAEPGALPFTQPFAGGSFASSTPTETDTDRCRCRKCKEPKKRKRSPSLKVASVHPYQRRMSNYSLKNLRRGKP